MKIKTAKGKQSVITGILADNITHQISVRYLSTPEDIQKNVTEQRPEFTCINHLAIYFDQYYLDREHHGIPEENDYFEIPDGTPDAEIARRAIAEFPLFIIVEDNQAK